MPPEITIGIPTYGGAKRMRWCLESICKVGVPGNAVIVILDDGSPDGGAAVEALSYEFDVDYIRHTTNRGIPAAWNSLTECHKTDITILLNDDIIVMPGWIEAMTYFLRNNPKAGGASWPFYFTNEEDIPKILAGKDVVPRDPITKKQAPEKRATFEVARPGRIMCVAGSCFGFMREMYELGKQRNKDMGLTGCFPEEYLSFHEESHWGTALAEAGFSSYGLTAPHLWHIWGATFSASPELNAGWRMQHSRKMYCEKWGVPPEFYGNPFNYTNPKYMRKIPPNNIKWLDKYGKEHADMEPDTRSEHI